MSRGEILAVEGVCCAGKTTLIQGLSAHLRAATVPELPQFARHLFEPFTNKDGVLLNGQRSVPLERVRMIAAVGLSELAGHVVMDRGLLSTLAINYGAIDVIGADAYRALAQSVLSQIEDTSLPLPTKALCLGVDSATVTQRNLTRVPRLADYWTNPARIDRQNELYRRLASVDGVEHINANQPPDTVLSDCITLAQNPTRIPRQHLVEATQDFIASI